jgi:hypothetical protein
MCNKLFIQVVFRNPWIWVIAAFGNYFVATHLSQSFKSIRFRIENTTGFQENKQNWQVLYGSSLKYFFYVRNYKIRTIKKPYAVPERVLI